MSDSNVIRLNRVSDALLSQAYHHALAGILDLPFTDEEGKKFDGEVVIFFRIQRVFYPVFHKKDTNLEDHIKLNPGTLFVCDINEYKVLWSYNEEIVPLGTFVGEDTDRIENSIVAKLEAQYLADTCQTQH